MTNAFTAKNLVKSEYKSLIFILLLLAVVYFPLADKAFHIDDTLFIKAAEQILVDPLDFYGGEVNWYGAPAPHYAINKNPPFVSYLIAAVASVFGFTENALHTFFFLIMAFSAIGIYLLGRQFNANPFLTAILATFTPVFLVHGINLMSDSTMLMFWIWGLVFWINGTRANSSKWFIFAGLSVSLGILTKYTCIFLLPLMIISGAWQYRKPGVWLFAVFIPLIAMFGFEYYTQTLYGRGLFLEAFIYTNDRTPKEIVDYFDNTLIGLSFLGGCFPVALLLMPLTGGRFLKLIASIFAIGVLILLFSRGSIGGHLFSSDGVSHINLIIQFCAFSLAGFCLVMACLKEISKGINHDSVFLLLWFFGIFIFVCYLNWTVNARSFILLVPAVGILLSRRLEEWSVNCGNIKSTVLYAIIGIASLIAVATMHADYAWADTARLAAREITSKYNKKGKVWFQGHWGFQYYMEKSGAQPVNFSRNDIKAGEFMAIPINNTNVRRPDFRFDLVEVMEFTHSFYVATMSPEHSAGFYTSIWGSMPYCLESPGKELYYIYRKSDRG